MFRDCQSHKTYTVLYFNSFLNQGRNNGQTYEDSRNGMNCTQGRSVQFFSSLIGVNATKILTWVTKLKKRSRLCIVYDRLQLMTGNIGTCMCGSQSDRWHDLQIWVVSDTTVEQIHHTVPNALGHVSTKFCGERTLQIQNVTGLCLISWWIEHRHIFCHIWNLARSVECVFFMHKKRGTCGL